MNIEKVEKKITNPELVDAINEMRKDYSPKTQNKVINLALGSTFLVPCTVSKDTQLVADENNHVHFDEKPQVKFLLITHKELGTFFPAFTDAEEISKFKADKPFQAFAMKFPDLATLTEQTPNAAGFVINPMNQNLPFTKSVLEAIKKTLIKIRQEREAAEDGTQKPNITVSSNDKK